MWQDVLDACTNWVSFVRPLLNTEEITPHEATFTTWSLFPLPADLYHSLKECLPSRTLAHSPDMSIGLVLFNFVWTHKLFHTPSEGIYRQVFGFSMGTNCAARGLWRV